jgi:hypothetical protein
MLNSRFIDVLFRNVYGVDKLAQWERLFQSKRNSSTALEGDWDVAAYILRVFYTLVMTVGSLCDSGLAEPSFSR